MAIKTLFQIGEASGIQLHLKGEAGPDIRLCSVKLEKSQLLFTQKRKHVTDITQLKELISPKIAIALLLTGKGILVKHGPLIDQLDQQNLNHFLPGATLADFYTQHFSSGELSFVAMIRKTEVDYILKELAAAGIVVLSLSLGPFPVSSILPQLSFYDTDIIFDGHVVRLNEQRNWLSYQYQEDQYSKFTIKAGDESLDERLVLPYAAAFQLVLAQQLDPVAADVPGLATRLVKHRDEQKRKIFSLAFLLFVFVILLINTVLLLYYQADNEKLQQRVGVSVKDRTEKAGLEQRILEKNTKLAAMGWEGKTRKSILLDQVASLLPKDVRCTAIAIDPLVPDAAHADKESYTSHLIKISGESENVTPVNEWLARIKTRPWVKGLRLEDFSYSPEQHTGKFTISIQY